MDYQESLDYILRFADYERLPRSGIVWDLRRVERLLERMGNPQYAVKTIHVAGTKGKGSTAAMIESVLSEACYRTGLYTSPHLLAFTERIKINGRPIVEADWAKLTENIRPEVEVVNEEGAFGELTTFEILTAMAFLHFREIKADYQVIEVGLGGRIDATNVVRPEICVITSISYDHTDVLGDTLAKIATEKAGIIKPGAVVISAPQVPEAMEVIERVCGEKNVRLVKAGIDFSWKRESYTQIVQAFRVKGLSGEYDIKLPLLGEYQMQNAALAVATAEVLVQKGAEIPKESVIAGLEKVCLPGRLQVLLRRPWLVVDEAHNAYSMQQLGLALREFFKYDRLTLILGCGSDKEVDAMVAEAARITGDIIAVASRHPKAVRPEVLAGKFAGHGITARTAGSVAEGVKTALAGAGRNDLVCAAGSIFVIAEVVEGS
ncbi:MAG TPA: bifunctional folylpolyglutamate synthase/dihydrofolate synthase [Dehalococcoidia bacterium]|nr:bifunctional folylpolyglutamate synthase/dihydrofolate synthase [Dehalococcoidia bacterium]